MRFRLRHLFIGFALVSVALALYIFPPTLRIGSYHPPYNNISHLTFSPDGAKLAITHFRARDAGVPCKLYVADVTDAVEVLDTATLSNVTLVDSKFRPGNQGPRFSIYGGIKFTPDGSFLDVT